jgi:hypothetical protein
MFRKLATAFALSLALDGASLAEEQPVDTPADWLKKPSADDNMSVWPIKSVYRNGKAIVACKVNTRGVLFGCETVMEKPEGSGFGLAALSLTPQFLMKPAMRGGVPIVSEVRIPIDFAGETKARLADPPLMRKILANPVWYEAPSQQAMAAAYPPKAAAQRLNGHVTLVCTFDKAATPHHCQTVREQPSGMGFSKAARNLAGQFKGPAIFADGTPTKGVSVQMLFSFAPEVLDGKLGSLFRAERGAQGLRHRQSHVASVGEVPAVAVVAGWNAAGRRKRPRADPLRDRGQGHTAAEAVGPQAATAFELRRMRQKRRVRWATSRGSSS